MFAFKEQQSKESPSKVSLGLDSGNDGNLGLLGSHSKIGRAGSESGSFFVESGQPATISTYQIPDLSAFYSSASIPKDKGVVNDPKTLSISDDARGVWFIKQFLKCAKTMKIDAFIVDQRSGGKPVPSIAPVVDYIAYFTSIDRDASERTENSGLLLPPPRSRSDLAQEVKRAAEKLAAWVEKETEARLEASEPFSKNDKVRIEEIELKIEELENVLNLKQDRYDDLVHKESERTEKMASEKAKRLDAQIAKAHEKHQQDCGALRRLETCLDMLKQWVEAQLLMGCTAMAETCKTFHAGKDPLEAGDMRAVYRNVCKRYRNSSEIGVTATTIKYVREALLDVRTLPEHLRKMEELAANWDELNFIPDEFKSYGREIISMIFVAGMKEHDRNAYMAKEDQAAEVCERMMQMQGGEGDGLDDHLNDLSIKSIHKKGQFQRLIEFGQRTETQRVLQGSFQVSRKPEKEKERAKSGKGGDTDTQQAAIQAFAAEGLCYAFQKGECKRGDTCRFKHVLESSLKAGVPVAGAGKGKGSAGTVAVPKEAAKVTGIKDAAKDCKEDKKVKIAASAQVPASNRFGDLEMDYSSEDEPPKKVRADVVLTAAVQRSGKVNLNWDTASQMHIANHMDVLSTPKLYISRNSSASGIGGEAKMTHIGDSELLGLSRMRLISSNTIPNLKSIGRSVQQDAQGVEALAIFGAKGAVQIRAPDSVLAEFEELIDRCRAQGYVEGDAEQRGYVYTQEFPTDSEAASRPVTSGAPLVAAVSVNLFAGRVKVDGAAATVDLLSKAGLSEETITEAATTGVLKGLPDKVTPLSVRKYFKDHGRDIAELEAGITKAVRRAPLDYIGEKAKVAGETLMIDNIDPSYSRVEVLVDGSEGPRKVMKPMKSIHGYRDAVLALDEHSGFGHLVGRVSKKNPHKLVKDLVERWQGRWRTLKNLKCDAEFVTVDSMQYAAAQGLRVYQAPPGEHAMVQGGMEGSIRWVTDGGQANMNRLKPLVEEKIITASQAAKLWFHATLHAVLTYNLKLIKNASGSLKTRLEEGTGKEANLSTLVVLPFCMPIVGKRLRNHDGRGMRCLYIGASGTVPGGILAFNPQTDMVSVLYQFIPIPAVIHSTVEEQLEAARNLYLGLSREALTESGELGPGSEKDSAKLLVPWPEQGMPTTMDDTQAIEVEPALPNERSKSVIPTARRASSAKIVAKRAASAEPAARRMEQRKDDGIDRTTLPYQTRNVKNRVLSVDVPGEVPVRPPKPKLPDKTVMKSDPRWCAARKREAMKLLAAGTFGVLPTDHNGRAIYPKDAMVHRLINRPEYKWKIDPETGVEGWLECVRCVSDGSVDKREDINCYAETPERVLLFLTLGLSATTGEFEATADVERAYLNADCLDKNIVMIAPDDMPDLPRRSLLLKGLYGERKSSLGWELYIDAVLKSLQWSKMDVCRGMYLKERGDGGICRALRHSDDLKVSATTQQALREECAAISGEVKMSPWAPVTRFLGVEIERVSLETGLPDPRGKIVLVRQREKIAALAEKFKEMCEEYNPKCRKRRTPGPYKAFRKDDELTPEQVSALSPEEAKVYETVVGCINWLVGARPEAKYHNMLLSKRGRAPRKWDMRCAAWAVDYFVNTKDTPLVLGGPVLDPQTTGDSSFGSMEERETVLGTGMTTGPLSGAVEAQCKATLRAMTSVWETELSALVAAAKGEEFVVNACDELKYKIPDVHKVMTDNTGVKDWTKGNSSNRRSRHIDIKYHYVRHAERDGRISVEYIKSKENYTDVLTKDFNPGDFLPPAARILGHLLVQGLGIPGVFELG